MCKLTILIHKCNNLIHYTRVSVKLIFICSPIINETYHTYNNRPAPNKKTGHIL